MRSARSVWSGFRRWPWWAQGLAGLMLLALVGGAVGGGDSDPERQSVALAGVDDGSDSTTTASVGTKDSTSTSVTATSVTTRPPATTSTTRPSSTVTTNVTAGPNPAPSGLESAVVSGVVDGDTVQLANGERLRLIGINSNEEGECLADEAGARLRQLIEGQQVGLERDRSDRDQYDRLLRYIWLDGTMINEVMVREGFAIAREYPPDTLHASRLAAAQVEAERAESGLWAPDACGAPSGGGVEITSINYDAPGNDNDNLNGEWADVANKTGSPISIAGWVLKDESASHRFTFPSGFVLAAGGTVRIYTGCGDDKPHELYWCNTGSAVWNNDGDTGFLLDANGNIVHTRSY